MAKVHSTAMGKKVDFDNILLQNEEVIAVGNMRVNARGDELGFGGKIVKTRDQIMKEYYALKSPVATDPLDQVRSPMPNTAKANAIAADKVVAVPVVAKVEEVVEPIIISPDSGLDEDDEGPVVQAVVDKPIEEVLAAPIAPPEPVSQVAAVQLAPPEPVHVAQVELAPSNILQTQAKLSPIPPAVVPDALLATSTPIQAEPEPQVLEIGLKPSIPTPTPPTAPLRGALASAVHSTTTITQKEKLPPRKANGIQRF